MIRILHRDLVKQDAKIQKHARLKKFFLNNSRTKTPGLLRASMCQFQHSLCFLFQVIEPIVFQRSRHLLLDAIPLCQLKRGISETTRIVNGCIFPGNMMRTFKSAVCFTIRNRTSVCLPSQSSASTKTNSLPSWRFLFIGIAQIYYLERSSKTFFPFFINASRLSGFSVTLNRSTVWLSKDNFLSQLSNLRHAVPRVGF